MLIATCDTTVPAFILTPFVWISRLVVVTFRVVFYISCLRVLFILALAVVAVRAWSYLFRAVLVTVRALLIVRLASWP